MMPTPRAGRVETRCCAGGFNASDLRAVGFPSSDLRGAGFRAEELEKAGYSCGALRTGVATSSGGVGEDVQVAIEGLVKVPSGTVEVNGQGVPMTPGARYCE